ncbi:DUF3857 domain-containing protein [Aurantiacibacter gilvus]|uniref:DUF3857 domain-containing protein n=1 Tax=Aurantiacibacter gilvus TaxID=3139141 RepID=A0ABU9IED6_9SPHN
MYKSIAVLPLVTIAWSAPVLAGEEVLYGPAPEWVRESELDSQDLDEGPATLLFDWQYRLEGGVVYSFAESATRLDNPQAVMQAGTVSLEWLPDNGDLTVHRVEILRDDEVVDLLAEGVTFEVIRRERALEQRWLDGELTATLAVPGLREDDVLRVAYTVSNDEEALGDEMQALQFLPSEPWQVGSARVIASWPVDEEMYYAAEERVDLPALQQRNGYNFLELDLPLAERDPVPTDAPSRFRRPDILRIGSFADWDEVSRVMAPHFEAAAVLPEGSPIIAEAEAIMARTADPLERAAQATQLVQDEVSYLFVGLDGGGYMPQSAEETWEIRYGDCKAKSVLLLSLLRHMGIESEVVLVNTQGGDAVPELLPLPAFDHMIVHAVIDGTDYWLDGTSSATRLATISDVPPFFYALPLREGGSGLVEMAQRDLAVPQLTVDMTMDHSAGIDFPALMQIDLRFVGPAAAQLQAMVDAANPDMIRQMAASMAGQGSMDIRISDFSITYDEEDAVGTISMQGIIPSQFEWSNGRLRASVEAGEIGEVFNPNRSRPSWREIPVATLGPARQAFGVRMVLPQSGEGFTLEGERNVNSGFGNIRLTREARLEAGELHAIGETFALLGEISPEALPQARREARRLANNTLELVPPDSLVWRWELTDEQRAERAAPLLAAYEDVLEFADEDNLGPLIARAQFLLSIYDFEAALADFDRLIDERPSAWSYWQRATIHKTLGNRTASLADLWSAYDLEYENGTAREVARELAYQGQADEAFELMESLAIADDERVWHFDMLATIAAAAGDLEQAQAYMAQGVADAPQSPEALNADCWFRGLWNTRLDDALEVCTRSIERASNASAALDSRALIRFRQGDYAGAVADLDEALAITPGLAESHYLRSIAKLHLGQEEEAQADRTIALRMAPHLQDFYAFHGIHGPG